MTLTETARDAAIFADRLAFALLAASSPESLPADRRAQLVKAFTVRSALETRLQALAELAPNCAAEGQQAADRLRLKPQPQEPAT